jgi:cysteine sulfinate desulfinase/cysteine desulfurase-like protein
VLRAMRVPFPYLHGAVRLSLSRTTTTNDIASVLDALPGVVAKLRDANDYRIGQRTDQPIEAGVA